MEAEKAKFASFGINTPEFTFAGRKLWARVVSVYDGDTVTLVFPVVDGCMSRFSARLHGIDTCEMKSKEAANKELAVKARNRLLELITGSAVSATAALARKDIVAMLEKEVCLVWIECLEFDKYGRVLVKMYAAPDTSGVRSFADTLVDEKLAYPYFGETKLTERDQVTHLN